MRCRITSVTDVSERCVFLTDIVGLAAPGRSVSCEVLTRSVVEASRTELCCVFERTTGWSVIQTYIHVVIMSTQYVLHVVKQLCSVPVADLQCNPPSPEHSKPCDVTCAVNCEFSHWSAWSECLPLKCRRPHEAKSGKRPRPPSGHAFVNTSYY